MTVSLNTEVQEEGVVLTIANGEQAGESAGVVIYDTSGTVNRWRHKAPTPISGAFPPAPGRMTREAAEFDALAWAAEYLNSL